MNVRNGLIGMPGPRRPRGIPYEAPGDVGIGLPPRGVSRDLPPLPNYGAGAPTPLGTPPSRLDSLPFGLRDQMRRRIANPF